MTTEFGERAPLDVAQVDGVEARWICSVTCQPCAWKQREDRGHLRWWCPRCQRSPFEHRRPGETELALVETVRALRERIAWLEESLGVAERAAADANEVEAEICAFLAREAGRHPVGGDLLVDAAERIQGGAHR